MLPAMYSGKVYFVVFFMAFYTCSMEAQISPQIEEITSTLKPAKSTEILSSKPYSERGARGITLPPVDMKDKNSVTTLNDSDKSTTSGYEEWWFYPTRRARLSFKDFPGRPGVATWKEISPSVAVDNRKSRKVNSPTAAGVSSSALSLVKNIQYTDTLKVLLVLLSFIYFC